MCKSKQTLGQAVLQLRSVSRDTFYGERRNERSAKHVNDSYFSSYQWRNSHLQQLFCVRLKLVSHYKRKV
jgi:hypothetical protein